MYADITVTVGETCKNFHIPYTEEIWEKLKNSMEYKANIVEINGKVYAVAHIISISRN